MSNAATTGLPFGSNRNVTCAIQAVAIEPPRLSASKRPDTASIAPASGSVALVFHRSRIIQASVRVAILPDGALLLDTASDFDDASDGLAPAARARVARAVERGPGHALLDLGTTELDAPLAPPLAFLRDVGRAFVARVCTVPDLEERPERVEVDGPPDDRARLAAGAGPSAGAPAARRRAGGVAGRGGRLGRRLRSDGVDADRGSPILAGYPGVRGGGSRRARARLVACAAPTAPGSGRACGREEAERPRDGCAARLLGRRRAGRRAAPRCRGATAHGVVGRADALAGALRRARPRAAPRGARSLGARAS